MIIEKLLKEQGNNEEEIIYLFFFGVFKGVCQKMVTLEFDLEK